MTDNKLTAYQRRVLQNQERIGKALDRIADALAPDEEPKPAPATGGTVSGFGQMPGFGGPGGPNAFGAGGQAIRGAVQLTEMDRHILQSLHGNVEPMTERDL